ncbi:GNAT family N-acetyltransferase [Salinarimonas ramus]|uniref:N-acetyltransferase GCN5 n=1 Tax=Salinarimonas ramus TaxID=690164 RepID=A0A917Q411_9HYPH|nr:GNAT family N-acetyltransferase [Salinarimonas ramus]GGK18519.1 N-acetyltransferase GCN5 [Salinarimonas ramus]
MRADPPAGYRIRSAAEADVPLLPGIEASAAALFAGWPGALAGDGPTAPPEALDLCRVAGTLWVAADREDAPVGFLAAGDLDGFLHVHEISVAREHQRRGLGRALMAAAIDFGRWAFIPAVTLTTDRIVPWNKPFYATLGFVELTRDGLPPGHAAKLAHELDLGFDPARRCVMAKVL